MDESAIGLMGLGAGLKVIGSPGSAMPTLTFAWRTLHKESQTGKPMLVATNGLLAVQNAPLPAATEPVPSSSQEEMRHTGLLRLEFARVRLAIAGKPDPVLLRTVLGMLTR